MQILGFVTIFCFYYFPFPPLEKERGNYYIFLRVLCQMCNVFETCMKYRALSYSSVSFSPGLICEVSQCSFYLCGPCDVEPRIIAWVRVEEQGVAYGSLSVSWPLWNAIPISLEWPHDPHNSFWTCQVFTRSPPGTLPSIDSEEAPDPWAWALEQNQFLSVVKAGSPFGCVTLPKFHELICLNFCHFSTKVITVPRLWVGIYLTEQWRFQTLLFFNDGEEVGFEWRSKLTESVCMSTRKVLEMKTHFVSSDVYEAVLLRVLWSSARKIETEFCGETKKKKKNSLKKEKVKSFPRSWLSYPGFAFPVVTVWGALVHRGGGPARGKAFRNWFPLSYCWSFRTPFEVEKY